MTLRAAAQRFVTPAQVRSSDNCGCVTANSPSDAVLGVLCDEASDLLHRVTGGAVSGRQSLIARPVRRDDWADQYMCEGLDAIPIDDEDPVITAVKINGVSLNVDTDVWLEWNNVSWMLMRRVVSGETHPRSWPSWQRRYLPDTEDNTFAIYFTRGVHVDEPIIEAAAIELVCALAQDDMVRASALEGATQVSAGGATIVNQRNVQRDSEDTRLKRIANGELGPMTRRMMGVLSPGGRAHSQVFAPELLQGWDMHLEIDTA